jgi:AmmeMemoRadiSam system protein A
MSEHPLDPRGSLLLFIARGALEHRFGAGIETWDDNAELASAPWLKDRAATFVSLHKLRRLRGCVGSLEPVRPLAEDVRRNAVAAALEDSRFPPLASTELGEVRIEVTLLAARVPISCATEREAIAQLRPGVDGVLLTHRQRRATFLPQVWESLREPRQFLAALKEKAGLPESFWDRSIVLERYTAQSWSEDEGPLQRFVM